MTAFERAMMVLEDREAQRQELLELERGMPYEGAVGKGRGVGTGGRTCKPEHCVSSQLRPSLYRLGCILSALS